MAKKNNHRYDERWHLVYSCFKPEEEKLRETLCTIGNGYFGTRGCLESEKDSRCHYPGTYLAGLYNRLASQVHGKEILNDDFVNCPNWLRMEFKISRGAFEHISSWRILEYEQVLNFKRAELIRSMVVLNRNGKKTRIVSRRFASMDNPHYALISLSLTPLNYSGRITMQSALDGRVVNNNVARYSSLGNKHLVPVTQGDIDNGIYLTMETNQSHTTIAMCAAHNVYFGKRRLDVKRRIITRKGFAAEQLILAARKNQTITVEKIVSIATSRDENTASAIDAALALISWISDYSTMFKSHQKRWRELWDIADVKIDGDIFAQKVIRLHIYHLLTTACRHNVNIDAGMPARGLHGEAYRGHIFWDSLFVLPFYYTRFPDVARGALMYRYRRLDAARSYARENGYKGAMFPWQSSNEGQEETQVIHYNPVSGKWGPDLSSRQRHVSIAIFYNIWEYYDFTSDTDFLHEYGAEMLIEIARFWVSAAKFNLRDNRYHIYGVMGPDEFHDKYPRSKKAGLKDNAYTNLMVVWLLKRAVEIVERLPAAVLNALVQKITFNKEELEKWRTIGLRMYVPITRDGILSQFEGYMALQDLDLDKYRKKYTSIHRMDRILKSEGDSPDKYKVAKQADVLMLFYVLSPNDVLDLLKSLGYNIKNKKFFMLRNFNFYEKRTSHGSSLSKVVHAAISRDMGNREGMWKWFMQALESDIYDTQGGTTTEGIHSGVMAGTINVIIRVMAGLNYSGGRISIRPVLPAHWKRLCFNLLLRGVRYNFEFTRTNILIKGDSGRGNPFMVDINKEHLHTD